MDNPLILQGALPVFSTIIPQDIESTIKQLITQNRKELAEILTQSQPYTWDNLIAPLDDMADRLNKAWSPVAHLHAVMETDELRAAYNAVIPLLTEYHTELMQNEKLYAAVHSLATSEQYKKLNAAQKKVIDNELRDFHLAGVDLSPQEKTKFAELQQELAKLCTKFSENVLDATHAWSMNVTDARLLVGMPEPALQVAAQNAEQRGEKGWTLTLDIPCYLAAMKYLASRDIRKMMHEAYVTRASEQGPNAGKWDNTSVIDGILKTRHALANLLGFKNYAEYSLATKMAKKPEQVLNFLFDLVTRSKSHGENEVVELTKFAKEADNLDSLEPWDLAYYSERLREKHYAISQEDLRPYFPVPKVLNGMFAVISELFGLKIVERKGVDVWNAHVQFFEIYNTDGSLRGGFYTDLYARPHKRDGAWMDDARVRRRLVDGSLQFPVAYLTCNFTRPMGDNPSYLTHDEVVTLFHEFGHCLHHLLTRVEYLAVSGINGVPWDAVEFPSQFLENWCWDKETLTKISQHEKTGEALPAELFNKMIAAKHFQPGMHILRQLEFAIFDFRLHYEFNPAKESQAQLVLNDVRKQVSVVPFSAFNRFQNSFSHIFAGGYAAGYYSYEWAQVLAADAFSRFEEEGIYNQQVGKAFLQSVLEQGGTREPMELFVEFRGREPRIDALLKHSGLV